MSFVRIKKINGNEYAYLVENKWYKNRSKGKDKGPRQKVSKYLGRVHSFNKTSEQKFHEYKKIEDMEQYIVSNTQDSIIKDLIRWELARNSIDTTEFSVNFSSKKVFKGKKEVSLRMNEGFLNSYTLRRLFNLKKEDSYYLAKSFIDAGIEIPKEIFIGLFSE
ncbi:hypothetical protein ISS07_01590 [Candidatus Woesearchaeota archaeon]|nr:hypothetical protein [Candidatus Woesearchaeota archaeon]